MSRPLGLVKGADGRLWFGGSATYGIGAIDTTGNVQYYPAPICGQPSAGSFCELQIGAALGNRVWFTSVNRFGQYVGYIDVLTGVSQEFALTPGDFFMGQPSQMTVGPDGNIWFLEFGKIGRATSAGQISVFNSGQANTYIITGPDDKLWYEGVNSRGDGYINRISIHGKMLPGGAAAAGSGEMTIGPNNQVWVATGRGFIHFKGRYNYRTITISEPYTTCQTAGLTVGSDNNLWFNAIGCPYGIGTIAPKDT
ncbi:MAG TPA: hypothetical protein VFE16_10255 [Candidatus Cybelea sp.]|nr:hypothetical protein [Candidatus Cybelea sp.]